jgi:hypothetical protein
MTIPANPEVKKSGLFLKYQDFKKLEKIIEEHNLDDKGEVDFNNIPTDEKEMLWKIKTIIRNMESVRLRVRDTDDSIS